MNYVSTRGKTAAVSAAQAIVAGLAPDGGLFLPESFPQFNDKEIEELVQMSYVKRAVQVLSRFLTDFTYEELETYVARAYAAEKFSSEKIAPIVPLGESAFVLELFNGPTCAFKDFALQLLPFLLTASLKKTGVDKTAVILVATSGDTGKAALEGFADVEGTKICVFYPQGGTSNIQRRQMTTQAGNNVMVFSAKGNFDDAQNGVKQIFMDSDFSHELASRGYLLSSANSINWGRLAPQIAYYFSAYCDLLGSDKIKCGEKINFVVPTGNFGNILAGYYAKQCGLPINKLICASNKNNVLTDFITTGVYDRNRPFYLTASPSMDILVSSNLERLLYLLSDRDGEKTSSLMNELTQNGRYEVDTELLTKLHSQFACGYADDVQTADEIHATLKQSGYLCDTHTAVALHVYREYQAKTGDKTPTVIAATASPFKFAGNVLSAAYGKTTDSDDFSLLRTLSEKSGLKIPLPLSELQNKTERFNTVILPCEMKNAISEWL